MALGHASSRGFALPGEGCGMLQAGASAGPNRPRLAKPRTARIDVSALFFPNPPQDSPPSAFLDTKFPLPHLLQCSSTGSSHWLGWQSQAHPSSPSSPPSSSRREVHHFATPRCFRGREGGWNYSPRQAGTPHTNNPHKNDFSCGKIHESLYKSIWLEPRHAAHQLFTKEN